MKKRLRYIVFLILMLIIGINGTYALTCRYTDGNLSAKFKINENNKTAGKVQLEGTITTKDKSHQDGLDETETIRNWDSAFSPVFSNDYTLSFLGKEYYINNETCPPYAFLVDRLNGLDFVVTDEGHKAGLEDFGKTKQGYALLTLIESEQDDIEYEGKSCAEYTDKQACEENQYFSCIWNDNEFGEYCNTDKLIYVQCGGSFDIPYQAPTIISFLITLLKIAIPIILVFVSIISLLKAIAASNEDEIKKVQKSLIRRVIAAVLAFFVISMVQFVIMKVAAEAEIGDISSCLSCFMNNDCDGAAYYKTNVVGTYQCTKLDGSNEVFTCPEYDN